MRRLVLCMCCRMCCCVSALKSFPVMFQSEEAVPAHIDLLWSFNNLITSAEQLQSSFLLSPDSFSEGDLATPPRKILNTLRSATRDITMK